MTILQSSIAPPTGGYQISRSLRFNSADSAYLNRTTTSSVTSNTTWTFSFWGKFSSSTTGSILGGSSTGSAGSAYSGLRFDSGAIEAFQWTGSAYDWRKTSTQVFRDFSAWYHIVFVGETGNATAEDRIKLYVNNVKITSFATNTNPSSSVAAYFASASKLIRLGVSTVSSPSDYLNGYLTEINFIDGQALTPSSFGQTNASTGVWEPVKYTGTYGTNGFYLNFSDNSNTTAATLGKDSSGNGNNWTPNNFSVTAGAGNDSLVDTPTSYGSDTGVGGEVRGNYCTLNPNDKNSGITLSNGNLDASMPTQLQNVYGTMSVTSGKWYWETTINSLSGRVIIGVGNTVDQNWNLDPSSSSALWGYYSVNGNKLNGSNTAYGNSFTANDVIGVAVDMDSGKIWFSKNGTWQASGDPAAGTNAAFTNLSGSVRPMYDQQLTNAVTLSCNFGQRPFAYTAPSGFKALCTQNLPTPTIGATSTTQANDYFDILLYNGNNSASTRSITGLEFQPDFIWIKNRNGANSHRLTDAVRGSGISLLSNSTSADVVSTTYAPSAFISGGFQTTTSDNSINGLTTDTYVAWNWNAGGSNATNTSGTITSTVRANTTAGFSIVTYTGTGVNATVGHGLGVVPSMIIAKRRSATQNWGVWHTSLTGTQTLYLDLTQGVATGVWNGTPTSTVFNITTDGVVNASTSTYVAYCFAAVAGYSAFSSYTGNGSSDGPFVYTGFRPRFIMIKNATTGGAGYNWFMYDTARDPYNLAVKELYANLTDLEDQSSQDFDILSNGFKFRGVVGAGATNGSGQTYIYAAFAESPFKYALAR